LFLSGPKVYDYLLVYSCVVDWIEGYESHYTRDQFLRTLHFFVQRSGVKPDGLLSLKPERIRRLVVEVARQTRDEGKHAWALALIKSVKSFCRYHGVELKFRRGETVRARRKRIGEEIVPSAEQIYRMVEHARSLRDKAIILCMWQSGVRIGCLVNWNFGLVRDQLFPENGEMKVPVRLKITEKIESKLRNYDMGYYYTFLGREASEALKKYLQWRIEGGEKLEDETPIFVGNSTTVKGQRLRLGSIREMIKLYAEKAGLNPKGIWPHCLRKAFRKVLNNADIDEDTKEALMGHKLPGSRGSYFDYHDVDEVERKYMRIDFSRPSGVQVEELRKKQVLDMVRILGFPEDRIKRVEEALAKYATVDEAMEEIRKLSLEGYKLGENSNNDPKKIVDETELEDYLTEGWDVQTVLPSGRILVRKSCVAQKAS
jgi:integrase